MLQPIRDSALAVGIQLVVTNSTEKIETQLNSLTHKVETGPGVTPRLTDLPIMLISWDIDTALVFDENGFLKNPDSKITALLMKKASDLQKQTMEDAAVEMGVLFTQFVNDLSSRLVSDMRTNESPITACTYKLLPAYGMGKHSGVMGKWNLKSKLDVC